MSLPSCVPAEESLLACYLLDPRLVAVYPLDLSEYYAEHTRTVAGAILALTKSGRGLTLSAIGAWLHSTNNRLEAIGGPLRLADILTTTATTVGAEHHWRNVRNAAHIRRFVDAATLYAQRAAELPFDGTADIADEVAGLASELRSAATPKAGLSLGMVPIASVSAGILAAIEGAMAGESPTSGPVQTGLRDLDSHLDGGIPPGLTVLGARTSHGKSAVALAIAEHASGLGRGSVAYFSFEMTKNDIFYRLLSWRTGIKVADLRAGRIGPSQFDHLRSVNDTLCNLELYGQSTEGRMTADQVSRAVDELRARQSVSIVIVDYVQILATPRGVQIGTDAVRYASGVLQQLAYRTGVPVVVLSQCNRDSEKGDRPRMHQLADSTALENDADCVMILHRPGKDDPSKTDDEIDVHVDKMRSGRVGSVKLSWNGRTGHPLAYRQGGRYDDNR